MTIYDSRPILIGCVGDTVAIANGDFLHIAGAGRVTS